MRRCQRVRVTGGQGSLVPAIPYHWAHCPVVERLALALEGPFLGADPIVPAVFGTAEVRFWRTFALEMGLAVHMLASHLLGWWGLDGHVKRLEGRQALRRFRLLLSKHLAPWPALLWHQGEEPGAPPCKSSQFMGDRHRSRSLTSDGKSCNRGTFRVSWGHRQGTSYVLLISNQDSWPFPVNRNWLKARQEIQARLYWCFSCAGCRRERKHVVGFFTGPLYGMRLGMCSEVEVKEWLGWFAHPCDGVEYQGACTVPCFCSQHPIFAPGAS